MKKGKRLKLKTVKYLFKAKLKKLNKKRKQKKNNNKKKTNKRKKKMN